MGIMGTLVPWAPAAAVTSARAASREVSELAQGAAADPSSRTRTDRLRQALADLSSSSWAGRERAQGELDALLEPEDLTLIAEFLEAAGAEPRLRLESVLGTSARQLELCARLASEPDPALRALGERAFLGAISEWWERPMLPARALSQWSKEVDWNVLARFSARLGARSLPAEFEQIVRVAGPGVRTKARSASVHFALDARLALAAKLHASGDAPDDTSGESSGFLELALELARHHDAKYFAFALESEHPFVVCVDAARGRPKDGGWLLLEWSRAVVQGQDPSLRAANARSLASTGWPAVLQWFENAWLAHGDEAALEGLLLAAARGRVAPGLARPNGFARALAFLDRAAARGDRELVLLAALGLGQVPIGIGEKAQFLRLIAEPGADAEALQQSGRLALVAGLGLASPELRASLVSQSAADDQPAAALPYDTLEVLRTLAATEPPSVSVQSPELLLRAGTAWIEAARARAEFRLPLGWLRAARIAPAERLSDPTSLPSHWGNRERWAVIEWWLAVPPGSDLAQVGPVHARAHLTSWLSSATPSAQIEFGRHVFLARHCGVPAPWEELLDPRADAGPPDGRPEAEIWALVAGLLPPARESILIEHVLAPLTGPSELAAAPYWVLSLAAAGCAGPSGQTAREFLLRALAARVAALDASEPGAALASALAEWGDGLELAISKLRYAREESKAQALLRAALDRVNQRREELTGQGAPSGAAAPSARETLATLRRRIQAGLEPAPAYAEPPRALDLMEPRLAP